MAIGPLEFLLIEFPGNKFKGEIVPVLRELVERGIIRVIDLVFVQKDRDGLVSALELHELEGGEAGTFASIVEEISGMLSEEDVYAAAEALEKNSSAALFLFEHTWASQLKEAVLHADGHVVANGRVPSELVEKALQARAENPLGQAAINWQEVRRKQ